MSFKRVLLVAAISMLALTPFLATGCGIDDSVNQKNTIGPGALSTAEELAKIPVK